MESTAVISINKNPIEALADTGFQAIVPKVIFLFGFEAGQRIWDRYKNGEYTVKELHMSGSNSILNLDYLWQNYVDYISEPDEYYTIIEYEDENGVIYPIVVEAIARRRRFKDGSLPIALSSPFTDYYADIIPDLELPECFREG